MHRLLQDVLVMERVEVQPRPIGENRLSMFLKSYTRSERSQMSGFNCGFLIAVLGVAVSVFGSQASLAETNLGGEALVKQGPVGGFGGFAFNEDATNPNERVRAVIVRACRYVDSVQFIYEDRSGFSHDKPSHGGQGGYVQRMDFDSDEFIVSLSGRYGVYLDSMAIVTNKGRQMTFGGPGGEADFKFEAPKGHEIIGLHGRACVYVDAIGVYTRKR
jgi:hypothetical protein